MSRKLFSLSLTASLFAGTALADVPRVATDIAPVHSLVSRVMEGIGMPDLIISQGASPHEYSLRPSEASALQEADVVFWIGEDLTPWLGDALKTLSVDAATTSLMAVDGVTLLDFREDALFEAHTHEHSDETDHDHGHDHKAHDHDHNHDHDHDHVEDHSAHAHGDHDPHVWLSPNNAAIWLNSIATVLSSVDPENADTYLNNAAAAREDLAVLSTEIGDILEPARGGRFIVFHDAYQYFETAFDFPASGAISISDASDPGPARIAQIQERVAKENISCVLSEPQFNKGMVATVMDGTSARTAVLDPIGSDLEPGPGLYPQMMRNLAKALADCL